MKVLRSFVFAWAGFKYCFKTQLNFKVHLVMGGLALLLGGFLHISGAEWIIILFCTGLVLFAEMLNTALEKFCDLVETGFHPGIRVIKDVAAGAVLVTALLSFCIGAIIYLPKIIIVLKSC